MKGRNNAYVVAIAPNGSVNLVTFFKGTPQEIRNWFRASEKKKASKVSMDCPEARAHDSSLPLGKPSGGVLSKFIA